jgi:hypothetical protein
MGHGRGRKGSKESERLAPEGDDIEGTEGPGQMGKGGGKGKEGRGRVN